MAIFEVGKYYNCTDCSISPILIIKRTAKMCAVQNADGVQWRMLIRTAGDNEFMIDTAVPKKWRGIFTYDARYKTKGGF